MTQRKIAAGDYDSLHPNVVRTGGDPSFMQTHGGRLDRIESDPNAPVHTRLFVPSRTQARPVFRAASSRSIFPVKLFLVIDGVLSEYSRFS